MDNCTAGGSHVHNSFLNNIPFLSQYILQKFCIIWHLIDCLCKGDIDFYFLEDVQEFRKLFFPPCFLKPLRKWHCRCISLCFFLLFLLIASLRLFSLYLFPCFCNFLWHVLLFFLSSFFLFFLSPFLPFFSAAVSHFFPTSQLNCHAVLWVLLGVTWECTLVLGLHIQG